MAQYTILKNTPLLIDLPFDMSDQGWTVTGGIAYHSGCNPGYITKQFTLPESGQYTFDYRVGAILSGYVKLVAEDFEGPDITTAGEYSQTFTLAAGINTVRFYSTGVNQVEVLKLYPINDISNARTIVFNEDVNQFGGDHSYFPDFFCKFIDEFFSFKNGTLWEHDVNEIYNNFYGTQYTSIIDFVANQEPENDKYYFTMKIDSTGRWGVPSITTLPNERYPNGMRSRLHENNFDLDDKGKYWADFFFDMNDPQFDNQLQALMEGRTLHGGILICRVETKLTTEVKLKSIYVYSSDNERNF